MTTVPKSKVVSIATVDTSKNAQLANLYTHLLETDDEIVIEPSNRKLIINCVKTCSKFKKYRNSSSIPEVLFCFDGQSNFLCSFAELSNLYFDISLPKKVLSRYSRKELSFDDKKKILYQIHVGEMFHEVAEIPWWALTLPQMIAFTQDKVEGISEDKVETLSYPHTWLAAKIKTGEEFKKQFGTPSQFDYATFGFSLSNPLDCSWSCVKTSETKLFNSKIKSLFAKSSVPPQSQNLTKTLRKRSKANPSSNSTTPVTKPPIVKKPSTEKILESGSDGTPSDKERVAKENQIPLPAQASSDIVNPCSIKASDKILSQVSSAEFVTTMNCEKLNSVTKSLNLDLPTATGKNLKTLAKNYMESADYQQRLLLTPFESLIFCFNDNSKFTCMYHELSETSHSIVIEQDQLEAYSQDHYKGGITFIDLKRILFHSLLSKKKYSIDLPWVGLTQSQKQSIAKTHFQIDFQDKPGAPDLAEQDDSMLLKALKHSPHLSHSTKRKPENNLMFEFSIDDPLQLKVWEIKGSDKLRGHISSLSNLLGIKKPVQHIVLKTIDNMVVAQSTESEKTIPTSNHHSYKVMTEKVGVETDSKEKHDKISKDKTCSKENGSNKNTLMEGGTGSWVPIEETLVTSTPILQKRHNPQLETEQEAIQLPSLMKGVACKICSKQYGTESTLECFICKHKVHYVCYKGVNGIELSQEHFEIFKQSMPNHKWLCNRCSTMPIESPAKTVIETQAHKAGNQLEKKNSSVDTKLDEDTPSGNNDKVCQDKIIQSSEMQNAAFETIDHVSAMNHTRECFRGTPKKSHNSSGDIGPVSPISEVEGEKECTPRMKSGWNSEILDKINLLLDQRKEDSKVISEILTSLKLPDRKTDHSYSGKLNSPHSHGHTYGIPEKPVKTTVNPALTLVISKDVSCSLSKGSSEIKKEFNKLYKDVSIEHCFASKGGSIFIELTDEDQVRKVVESWKTSFFADDHRDPHRGTVCKLLSCIQNSVIIKAVPTEIEEEYIQECIQGTYPGAKVKRFVKTGNVKLRTIKIDFKTPGQSNQMIKNGLLINNLSLRAEKYKARQRVIQCYHCYKFGHVAKFCHQKNPTCPLCAQSHYQEDCDHTSRSCSNCASPNHYATNKTCPKFRAVLERITNINNYQSESQNLLTELDHDL